MNTEREFWSSKEVIGNFSEYKASPAFSRFLSQFRGMEEKMFVLDLGCGAGRNTVLAASKGFQTYACDNSALMVRHTIKRLMKEGLVAKVKIANMSNQ